MNRPPIGLDALNGAWQLSEAASTTENYRMAMPTTPEIEALISEATAPVPDGSSRLDVLDDAVTAALVALRVLSTVVDRQEGEIAELRSELASTRKIAKQAKKRAGRS